MECKTTSAAKQRCAGLSLVEVLIVGTLSILAAGAIMSFSLFSSRSLLATSNKMDLEAQARRALDQLTKEMRRSLEATAYGTNSMTLLDHDKKEVTFAYDPSARQLTRTKNKKTTVLLGDCDSLTFSMYGRVPNSGSYDLDPVTDPALCKAINVTWSCSRIFIKPRINALSTISATIILRLK